MFEKLDLAVSIISSIRRTFNWHEVSRDDINSRIASLLKHLLEEDYIYAESLRIRLIKESEIDEEGSHRYVLAIPITTFSQEEAERLVEYYDES